MTICQSACPCVKTKLFADDNSSINCLIGMHLILLANTGNRDKSINLIFGVNKLNVTFPKTLICFTLFSGRNSCTTFKN